MDLEEVILLSSDDEAVFNPGQNPHDESDKWSGAFFDPDKILRALEESLDLEETLEGTHSSLGALPTLAYDQVLSFSYSFVVITNDTHIPLCNRHG